jgi:hypothetical protein
MFMRTRQFALLGFASVAVLACSSAPRSSNTPAPTQAPTKSVTAPAPAAVAATFAWPGIYDLVGTGFPEGDRNAVLEIARNDTSYTLLKLQGPPGQIAIFQVTGDRAHIVWNLGPDLMYVDLRGTRDSVAGEWYIGDDSGSIRGARRR